MNDGLPKNGVLLLNLGTPDAPTTGAVRRYLQEFLSDERVIDTHPLLRTLLLYGVILPFRSPRSSKAYQKIWTERGSPLLVHSRDLETALQAQLPAHSVALGMRYGQPSIADALDRLESAGVERVVVLPLFPQYASSSTGSAIERVFSLATPRWGRDQLSVIPPFYARAEFIATLTEISLPRIDAFAPDHVLMSYHGLPERQIRKLDTSGTTCFASANCCEHIGGANANCYRAQCFQTSRALARELDLDAERWSVSFQSRLGRTPWIRPFTDHVLPELAQAGVRRLAVICPSFVADCLETLEEIGIRAREQWGALGGNALELIPCPNSHPTWVATVADWVRSAPEA